MIIKHLNVQNLKEIWYDLTSKYTSDTDLIGDLWNEISKSYSAKDRHYHNLNHLDYMINLAFQYKSEITDFDTLLFSIFYHDIVYDVKRSDNELKSAGLASDRLQQLGVKNVQIVRCREHILATKEHKDGAEQDTNFLVDFDLAILGDSPEKYIEYTKRIRKEYTIYPDLMYSKGRKKVLMHFLEMDKVYKTKEFKTSLEARARKNIKAELDEF